MLFFVVEHAQHVRRMRSSIVSMIQSVLEFSSRLRYHTLVLTGDSSYISGNISSPFLVQRMLL